MDSATLQAKYSGDIAFRGGADTQGGLPFGSHLIAAGEFPRKLATNTEGTPTRT